MPSARPLAEIDETGIVGLGHIGSAVAARLSVMGRDRLLRPEAKALSTFPISTASRRSRPGPIF
ncbi:hypothetical protein F2981_25840 (plasmid) [Sinorhizobium meliloti]|nr:hypothetical protein [Sinorhizobium meliloti]